MKNTLLVVVLALFVSVHGQIVNGGFEDNSCGADTWCEYGPGNWFPGWTVGDDGNIDIHFASSCCGTFMPHSGSWSVDLNGDEIGSISQTVPTKAENQYTVTFWLASNPNCGPQFRTFDLSANGASTESYSFDTAGTDPSNPGWTQQTYSFTATSSSTTLNFVSTTPDTSCGPAIDDLSIVEYGAVDICSQFSFGDQGMFCTPDQTGYYNCLGGPFAPLSTFQPCAAGTTCWCDYGVECSEGGTVSPCRDANSN